MTPDDVRKEIENIRAMQGDPEGAHSREDDLYLQLLTAIANGKCENPALCAKIAIQTQELDFARWCA